MPLGASRVEGERPLYESFRYPLWQDLKAGGYEFDFIGTRTDQANYPDFMNQPFDRDHEGRGGWTSGQIRTGLANWLDETGAPDLILFSSPGGNDALEGLPYDQALENINAIIDQLQQANPEIIILIEEPAPARSDLMTGSLKDYFERIQADVAVLARRQSDNLSRVIAVDMHSGFSDSLLADEVHYNEAGAEFIAEKYFAVLEDLL